MGTVAQWLRLRRFAAAKPDLCCPQLPCTPGARGRCLVGAVAEGLLGAAAADAPQIVPAGLDIDRDRATFCAGMGSAMLYFLRPLPWSNVRPAGATAAGRTLVNAWRMHKAGSHRTGRPLISRTQHDRSRSITLLLAAPRGFCAGVDRAIQIVERALERYGAPVYVRHEIVHNRYVVESLETQGRGLRRRAGRGAGPARPVVFSAHGVPKSVPARPSRRQLIYLDATCPLVSKVHREAERHHAAGRHIVLIGHAGHPEVIGTMGQLPDGAVTLVETAAEAEVLEVPKTASARLHHADDAVRRRHGGHRRRAAAPLPADRGAAARGHLLRHHQPPAGGEGDRARVRCPAGAGRAQFLQLRAAGRGGARAPAAPRPGWSSARADIDWSWLAGVAPPRHHRRRVGAGGAGAGGASRACRERFAVTIEETCRHRARASHFKLPRALTA